MVPGPPVFGLGDAVARRPRAAARRLIALVFTAAVAVLPAGLAGSQPVAPANVITDTRIVGDESRTRFIADLSAGIDIAVFAMADPYRIVIDLPEVHFQLERGAGEAGRGLISAFRYGLISRGKSRIVLDVTEPVRVDDYFVLAAVDGQPARLVIDLVRTTPAEFMAAALAYRNSGTQANPAPLTNNAGDGRLTVVIDPGHGGIDPGAVGLNNTLEKDVVLAFSQELAGQLRATGRYEVILTREDDTFLSLNQRVEFARNHRADIFLSIHANSFSMDNVRGMAVYTVSERASNEMAAVIAAGENRADILAGVDLLHTDDMVADILIDLARRETKNFSVALARNLVTRLQETNLMTGWPHQEAGFVVLKAPDVASVLIELGFLSNVDDERILRSAAWREQTATSMVRAVEDFFTTRLAAAP